MLWVSLAIAAALGSLLVYRYDMYEKEPPPMLLLAGLLGAGSMVAAGLAEERTLNALMVSPYPPAGIAMVASTHEEIVRLLVVAAIALLVPRHFNDPMDGIIYGSMVGLGMAVAESIAYLSWWRVPMDRLIPATEIVRLFGHLVFAGIACFGLGMARMKMRGWALALAGGLGVAIILHFLWDWIAFSAQGQGAMRLWQSVCAAAIMLTGLLIYGMFVVIGADWSRAIFAPHSKRQLWGWPIDVIIARTQNVKWKREVRTP